MSTEAQAALDIANDARRRMAVHARSPTWYAPLYGLGIGGMVASFALPTHLISLGSIACMLGIVALYVKWQNQSGLSVNGYRRGRTLPVTIVFAMCISVIVAAAAILRFRLGISWGPLACGAIAAVIAAFASDRFDRVWRAEMADAP